MNTLPQALNFKKNSKFTEELRQKRQQEAQIAPLTKVQGDSRPVSRKSTKSSGTVRVMDKVVYGREYDPSRYTEVEVFTKVSHLREVSVQTQNDEDGNDEIDVVQEIDLYEDHVKRPVSIIKKTSNHTRQISVRSIDTQTDEQDPVQWFLQGVIQNL